VTLTGYTGCSGGADVDLYSIAGEGHEWPSGPPLPKSWTAQFGPQSTDINANSIMWAFFQDHPMR
jgi:polyhydroxybutyrate depolymerase